MTVWLNRILPHPRGATGTITWIGRHSASVGTYTRKINRFNPQLPRPHLIQRVLTPAAPIPLEKPAQASASDPMSISPGDSAPSLPRVEVPAVKPQRASVSGAAMDQSAQQGAQEAIPQASPALSIQAPAPQASQSSQTSDQGATTRSVPAPPDPPIATFKAQERTAPPSDSPTEFIQPTADTTAGTSVPDDAKSTARDGGSTANAAGTAASVTARPWKLEIRM